MRLEAVTICVGYGDFLAETLPLNRPHVDRLVVVTKPDDTETQEVCAKFDAECVTTHAFGPNGGFCKGAGINVGLNQLDLDGWVLHLDADTVLPIYARQHLERRILDPTCIYGADRINVVGEQQFATHISERRLQAPPRSFGVEGWWCNTIRCVFYDYDGWLPVGYFQLWNPDGSGIRHYPEDRLLAEPAHAGNTDLQFAAQWPLQRRVLLPELLCCHVESEQIGSGANWHGRKTKRFAATAAQPPPAASDDGRPERQRPHLVAPPLILTAAQYANHQPVVGETLGATTGEWVGAEPLTYTYQWFRGLLEQIPDATGPEYTVAVADVRRELRVRVTASNQYGDASAHSHETGRVIA